MAGIDLKNIVDRIVDLPTLPQIVTRIIGLIEDPNSSARDINDVMSHDPALVAKILKLVNSSFYGLPNRVTSIQQAITILGFNTVKSLAISASVFDLFGEGDEHFSYENFWTHSICTATVSTIVAEKEPDVSDESAFVVGLLHGLGKLVLDQYATTEFRKIVETAREKEIPFHEAETEVIETSYSEIGYWLTCRWQLAPEVQIPIQFQNRIEECPEEHRATAATIAFSAYICRLKGFGANGDGGQPKLPHIAWDSLHIEKGELPALVERINEEIKRAEGFLELIHM